MFHSSKGKPSRVSFIQRFKLSKVFLIQNIFGESTAEISSEITDQSQLTKETTMKGLQ